MAGTTSAAGLDWDLGMPVRPDTIQARLGSTHLQPTQMPLGPRVRGRLRKRLTRVARAGALLDPGRIKEHHHHQLLLRPRAISQE